MHITCPPGELDAKVAFLRQPSSYPDPAHRVEVVETHMSWVFLLDQHVYKLKKPVCLEGFDCRTLRMRHHLCNEELRLNRRLAPHVYLDVVALTVDAHRRFSLAGRGRVVDWLVRMVRLPADRMLDHLILCHALSSDDMRAVAARLTRFYLAQPFEPVAPGAYREALRQRVESNRRELGREAYALPLSQVESLYRGQLATLAKLSGVLDQRAAEKKIVEGHGDLRPEHVCLGPELAIIDCLEFSRALRTADIIDELGFLALECERLGAPEAGKVLLDHYGTLSGDWPDARLVHFYQSCRAASRAKITARHMLEPAFRDAPEWHNKAMQYLGLAEDHLARCKHD